MVFGKQGDNVFKTAYKSVQGQASYVV